MADVTVIQQQERSQRIWHKKHYIIQRWRRGKKQLICSWAKLWTVKMKLENYQMKPHLRGVTTFSFTFALLDYACLCIFFFCKFTNESKIAYW